MLKSDAPSKIYLGFANSGAKNTIPIESQIGTTDGKASLVDGFPPKTMMPVASGGIPPSGLDMNGILNEVSSNTRWYNAGGGFVFDSSFANNSHVLGYPKGAKVLRTDGLGYWFNTIDNNITDPESTDGLSSGWLPDITPSTTTISMTNSNVTLTYLQYSNSFIIISGTLSTNVNLIFPALIKNWIVENKTTGNYTITAKTSAGTGIVIPSNSNIVLYGNGTNILSHQSVFLQQGTSALTRTVQNKLKEHVSLFDFLTDQQITDYKANALTDLSLPLQAAINSISKGTVYLPAGGMSVNNVVIHSNITLQGEGLSTYIYGFSDSTHTTPNDIVSSSTFIIGGDAYSTPSDSITIKDLYLDGRNDLYPYATERVHLLSLLGGSHCLIENVYFKRARGDCIYMGGRYNTYLQHNSFIKIENCFFDGGESVINRNAISICDGQKISISNCDFEKFLNPNMPGAIDIEPYTTDAITNRIRVDNCNFESIYGFNGCFGMIFQTYVGTPTSNPYSFIFNNNRVSDISKSVITVINQAANNYTVPINLIIEGNTGNARSFLDCVGPNNIAGTYAGTINRVLCSNNDILCEYACLLGYNHSNGIFDSATNIIISNNRFVKKGSASSAVITFMSLSYCQIHDNQFIGWDSNYCIQGGYTGTSVSYVSIKNNCVSTANNYFAHIENTSTVNAITCSFSGNYGPNLASGSLSNNFPAYITDHSGALAQGDASSFSTFNSTVLPDSFPPGLSAAVINGDTGVPAYAGLNQGVLYCFKQTGTTGYTKFIYQVFVPANNTSSAGVVHLRKAVADNTWGTWLALTAV